MEKREWGRGAATRHSSITPAGDQRARWLTTWLQSLSKPLQLHFERMKISVPGGWPLEVKPDLLPEYANVNGPAALVAISAINNMRRGGPFHAQSTSPERSP